MTYKLKSGAAVDGSPEQILAIAKALGETVDLGALGITGRGYYNSTTKGIIEISKMETSHIRNALLKQSKVYYEKLSVDSKTLSNHDFLTHYMKLAENPTVVDLFTELSKRKS